MGRSRRLDCRAFLGTNVIELASTSQKPGSAANTPGATRKVEAAVPLKGTTTKVPRECLVCGATFHVLPTYLARGEGYGLFCSPRCRGIHGRKRITLECAGCGLPFETTAVHVRRGRKYCSQSCMTTPPSPKVEAVCTHCGQTYRQYPSRMIYEQSFCSKTCMFAYMRESRPEVTCEWCGVKFYDSPAANRRYCSKRCYGQSKTDHDREDRKSWRYRAWRRAVLNRDGHQCQRCGSKSDLHAHHIQRWSKRPDLRFEVANGITLCASCHAKEEPWLRFMRR